MKYLLIVLFVISFSECRNLADQLVYRKITQIAIQPLDDFDSTDAESLKGQIGIFYKTPVVILHRLKVSTFYDSLFMAEYDGDSLLSRLANFWTDKETEFVALTTKNIYEIKSPGYPMFYQIEEGVFGVSNQPGNFCIISGSKFKVASRSERINGLKNVIIHEIGHNLGLSHCLNEKCAMNESNDAYAKLVGDKFKYCSECKKKLLKYPFTFLKFLLCIASSVGS